VSNHWDPDVGAEANVLEDCVYSKEHEYARKNEDGTYTIGVTPFAIGQLGDITLVTIELDEGEVIESGSEIGTIESVKTLSDLFSPISGKVISINRELEDQPELVNDSTWDNGWLIIVEPDEDGDSNCLSPDEYREFTRS